VTSGVAAAAAQFEPFTPMSANASSVGANTVYCPFCESVASTAGLFATRQMSVSKAPAYGPELFTAMAVSTMLGLAAAGRADAAVGTASAATAATARRNFRIGSSLSLVVDGGDPTVIV
jgi:hypothetical protein